MHIFLNRTPYNIEICKLQKHSTGTLIISSRNPNCIYCILTAPRILTAYIILHCIVQAHFIPLFILPAHFIPRFILPAHFIPRCTLTTYLIPRCLLLNPQLTTLSSMDNLYTLLGSANFCFQITFVEVRIPIAGTDYVLNWGTIMGGGAYTGNGIVWVYFADSAVEAFHRSAWIYENTKWKEMKDERSKARRYASILSC